MHQQAEYQRVAGTQQVGGHAREQPGRSSMLSPAAHIHACPPPCPTWMLSRVTTKLAEIDWVLQRELAPDLCTA